MEFNVTKFTELFQGLSPFGRGGKEAVYLQDNIFHINRELVQGLFHSVMNNMCMAVATKDLTVGLFQFCED